MLQPEKRTRLRKRTAAELDDEAVIVPALLEPLVVARVGPKMRDLLTAQTDEVERAVPDSTEE